MSPLAGVTIDAVCAPGLAAIATPDLLYETMATLVENAVMHTAEGTIHVSAAMEHGTVRIAVSDTGPGIAAELHDRVFEPFFRATHDGSGYGLGLAIAAEAVKAMRGTIDVSSELGRGTTFTVTLPGAEAR